MLCVFTTAELIAALRERGVRNKDIERALDYPSSRVSDMLSGKRRILLDEAAFLARHFQLEDRPPPSDLPTSIAKLAIMAIANELGSPLAPHDPRLSEIAADFRAFLRFVADPQVRDRADLVEGFLAALRMRREIPPNHDGPNPDMPRLPRPADDPRE